MPDAVTFHIEDSVTWDTVTCADRVVEFAAEHGDGPFRVVGVRLLTKDELTERPDAHPEMVTIEVANARRQDVSGELLIPV
jgi:hypothetical protein